MFHQFFVPPEESTYMRFYWFKNNDPDEEPIEYWSRVHIMGKRHSPGVANIGLKYAAIEHKGLQPVEWMRVEICYTLHSKSV